jgi:hypothetical protein
MQYGDSIEDSRRHIRLSGEPIGQFGLPTDPVNDCIWYEHASGKKEPLNLAIDVPVQEKGQKQGNPSAASVSTTFESVMLICTGPIFSNHYFFCSFQFKTT